MIRSRRERPSDPGERARPRISAECKKLLETVRQALPGVLPGDPVRPGTVVDDVALEPAEAAALFPAAAALAAGVDQPGADPTPRSCGARATSSCS